MEVEWVTTARNRKRLPLDPGEPPLGRGNIIIGDDGLAYTIRGEERAKYRGRVREAHAAICPKRRRR